MVDIEKLSQLIEQLAALGIEAEDIGFDPEMGRAKFTTIQERAYAETKDSRIRAMGKWPALEPMPAHFTVTLASTGFLGSVSDRRYWIREWCNQLIALLRPHADKAKSPSRPAGTGMDRTDGPLLDRMHELLTTRRANSPSEAVKLVMKESPELFRNTTEDDSHIRRLVGKYARRGG
ncbi:hypothetical protein [Bradyrhizobium ottawaense]|uniref:hypothetical protein n=1 Tax=Bradyrhizobium ottawaense TaxID=931866 RepID=UPI001BA99F65|nr:hypothetical protein [Bradyrhizobium ottawaense]MBR1362928.1 hypothetical protein [Bradyrhizobium ottawaense]